MKALSIICLACCALLLTSCSKKVGPTTVKVDDPVRHYYPLIVGQELELVYKVTNIGTEPLIIQDVQPSCGCIVADLSKKIVPPKGNILLKFTYNSEKNVGYVRHVIRLFGNIKPDGVANLVFDVNVVPNADYTRDYEELYNAKKEKEGGVEELVDGKASEKGYYVDITKDSRSHAKYPWRKE